MEFSLVFVKFLFNQGLVEWCITLASGGWGLQINEKQGSDVHNLEELNTRHLDIAFCSVNKNSNFSSFSVKLIYTHFKAVFRQKNF